MEQVDYSFLDLERFRKLYSKSQEHPQIQFYVEGIQCSNCMRKIEKVSEEVDGIECVRVNMADRMAEITLSDSAHSFSKAIDAIVQKGFRLTPVQTKKDISSLKKKNKELKLLDWEWRLFFQAIS